LRESQDANKKQSAAAWPQQAAGCLKTEGLIFKARGRGEKAAWQSRLEPVITGEAVVS